MKDRLKILSVCVLCLMVLSSCKTTGVEFSSDKFIVVETVAGDTPRGLAKKYLNDPDKDWLISEFNKTDELWPGKNIIIPLSFFNKGGLKTNGYQVVPVLNYNGFSSENGTKQVSAKEFTEQMLFLQEQGYRVIPTASLLDFIDYKNQLPEKAVVLTATCNINSFYEIAFPVLQSFGYSCTLFVDPEKIGKRNTKTWSRIRKLSKKGVDIQACDETPQRVTGNSKSTLKNYFYNLEEKISNSKKDIEAKTGGKCILYASPTGGENNILTSLLAKKGYKAAFFDNSNKNPFFVDKFGIGRTVISGGLTIDGFRKKIATFQHMDLN